MQTGREERRATWLRRGAGIALIAIAVTRIVSTYPVFNQVYDEPFSVACGMEWLDRGTYTYDPKHPPLGRVATAIGLYLKGVRSTGVADDTDEGNALLGWGGQYWKNLVLARLGVLPFFVFACLIVWAWAAWAWGSWAGILALAVFSLLPPVLGHAGIAMTDIVLTATLPAALLSLGRWLESPTIRRSSILGASFGLAILSKLSALVFLPLCGLPLVLLWRRSRSGAGVTSGGVTARLRFQRVAVAAAVTVLVIWAGYRFSIRPVSKTNHPLAPLDRVVGTKGFAHDLTYLAIRTPLPAGDFFRGVAIMATHNYGHVQWNYFLGDRRAWGWLFFYPILLVVKTPPPFLVLLGAGLVFMLRANRAAGASMRPETSPGGASSRVAEEVLERRAMPTPPWRGWAFVWSAGAMLAAGLMSQVNTGIRHVLPIYVMLACIAAFGALRMLKASRAGRVTCAALLLWLAADSALAHPDYLWYFSEFTGGESGRFGVDSDLDYGQDLERLRAVCVRRQIESLSIAYHGTANLRQFALPNPHILAAGERPKGWVAISMYKLKLGEPDHLDCYKWIESFEPVERVGKSIRLYYIPAAPLSAVRCNAVR